MGNRQPKLSKEDLDLLMNKTCFTKVQIKQWYKGFMVSDACIAGTLAIYQPLAFHSFNRVMKRQEVFLPVVVEFAQNSSES